MIKKLSAAITALTMLGLLNHCDPGTPEGSRCDNALSHDECANAPDYQCIVPPNCPESYCCAVSGGSITSSEPFCQNGCNGGLAAICAAAASTDVPAVDGNGNSVNCDGGTD